MNVQPAGGLLEVLQRVPDPRGRLGRRHSLSAILAAVVCATLCGFRGIRAVVHWLELHGVGMWHLLGFTRKPPVRQTFANVLAEIDPDLLEAVLLEFVEQLVLSHETGSPGSSVKTGTAPSAADVTSAEPFDVEIWGGKTLRGTRHGEQRAEQVLVRIQHSLAKVLSSTAISSDTNESKTNYDLVRRLVLKGKLIVGDAAYCQSETCESIVEQEADYLVTVKGNQPQLLRDIEQAFVIPRSRQSRFVSPRDLVRQSIAVAQFDVTDNPPSAAPTPCVKRWLNSKPRRLSRRIAAASKHAPSPRPPRRSTNNTSPVPVPSSSSAWNVAPPRRGRLVAVRPTPSPACRVPQPMGPFC